MPFFWLIQYYKRPIDAFLVNDIFIYDFIEKIDGINSFITCIKVRAEELILNDSGLKTSITKIDPMNTNLYFDKIKEYLDKNILVMITADLFYYPTHSTQGVFYQKMHHRFNFDYGGDYFNVISTFDVLNCCKEIFSFDNLTVAIKVGIEYCGVFSLIRIHTSINGSNTFDDKKILDFTSEQIYYGEI